MNKTLYPNTGGIFVHFKTPLATEMDIFEIFKTAIAIWTGLLCDWFMVHVYFTPPSTIFQLYRGKLNCHHMPDFSGLGPLGFC